MADMFRVFFFARDGVSQEETLQPVPAQDAVAKAKRLTDSLPAKTGSIQRVVITDADDCCVFEWIHGQGVVFPPPPLKP